MSDKNTKQITRGTCEIYIDDIFIGYSGDEVVLNVARDKAQFFSGLPQIPVTEIVTKEEVGATFEFKQINPVNVSLALGKDGVIDTISKPNFAVIEMGGDTSVGIPHLLELVHYFPDDRQLEITFWKAMPDPTFELAFNSGSFLGIKSKWTALEDSTKEAGKRLMRVAIEDEQKS
jgi:hypothetical protein